MRLQYQHSQSRQEVEQSCRRHQAPCDMAKASRRRKAGRRLAIAAPVSFGIWRDARRPHQRDRQVAAATTKYLRACHHRLSISGTMGYHRFGAAKVFAHIAHITILSVDDDDEVDAIRR